MKRAFNLSWVLVMGFLFLGISCSHGKDGTTAATTATVPTTPTTIIPTTIILPTIILPTITSATTTTAPPATSPEQLSFEILQTIDHDPSAFTQGLIFNTETSRFYESTGAPGNSVSSLLSYSLSEPLFPIKKKAVEPANFALFGVPKSNNGESPTSVFAEGLERIGDQLFQLTWMSEIVFVWSLEDFEPVNAFSYSGEGWGLCFDGTSIYMSNGTGILSRRNPDTFTEIEQIIVKKNSVPLDMIEGEQFQLNELECAKGFVWANVWFSDEILRIDPASGEVTGILDAGSLETLRPKDSNGVLNGIAYDSETDSFWLTGKYWANLYRVRIS